MLRKALWDLRWATFWYAVGGAGYTFLVALFYPTVRQNSESISKLVSTYPKGMLAVMGYTDMTSFIGYMGVETLNLFWPIIVIVFATLGGASLVAKEVEDGTSEIWLSVPAERWHLLLAKMAALALGLLVAVAACVATVAIDAAMVAAPVTPLRLLALGVVMAVLLFAVAGYSGLLSALVSSRGLAAGASFGITVGSYLLWVIGGLSDRWKQTKDFSVFTAYTPQKALESGTLDPLPITVLLAITVLCVILALFAFQRRDAI